MLVSKKAYRALHLHLMSACFWEAAGDRPLTICHLLEAQRQATYLARNLGSKKRPRYTRFAPEARRVLALIEARQAQDRVRLWDIPVRALDYFEGVEGT